MDWVQRWLSFTVVADTLASYAPSGTPMFEFKGGAAIEMRMRRLSATGTASPGTAATITPRATKDLDATFRGEMKDLVAAVQGALSDPRHGFTFRVVVQTPDAPHMVRFRVRVSYLVKGVGGPNGDALSPQTVRRHLMELSAMFERARFAKYLDVNPLDKHPDIPPALVGSALEEAGFLTPDEVGRLLNEVVPNSKSPWAVEQAYVLFYTGCRLDELNGILVKDIDFTDQVIHVVDHEHRSIKSKMSRRRVPLWPKLADVLQASLARVSRPANGILFPRAGSNVDCASLAAGTHWPATRDQGMS